MLKHTQRALTCSFFIISVTEDPSLDADPLQCQQDMEAVVDHQAAEVDLLHQAVVAILPLLLALVNAFALQEKAAWLGEQEKKPPIMLALTHTKNLEI